MNYVKVKSKFRPGSQETISVIPWLDVGVAYPIIDVYKYLEKNKETGASNFRTWFLVGNAKTGVLGWAESHSIDFAGCNEKELNLKSNILKAVPEEEPVIKQEVKKEIEEVKPEGPAGISFAF